MNLRELIYPKTCPFCGRIVREKGPCVQCLKSATELTAEVCRICGAYPENCRCMGHSFSFLRNVSAFAYEGAPRTMLLRFKQRNRPQLAGFMANRMYHHIRARLGEEFSAVVYVPQAYKSALERGYCPAQLLAEQIADRLQLPCIQVLRRCKTKQQKYLSVKDRWANAQNSYELIKGKALSGRVLLIDDLLTTGATLNRCAALLLEAGAEQVCCATFAIAVKNS